MTICFLGDSFVEGVGDPRGEGWAGRLLARARARGLEFDAVNLGVRGQTSVEIANRLDSVRRVFDAPGPRGLVCSFGTNDCAQLTGFATNGPPREYPDASIAAAARVFATADDVPVLFVIPPPVDDAIVNDRVDELVQHFDVECRRAGVAVADPRTALRHDRAYLEGLGDGAHPGETGYERLADLISPAWRSWASAVCS